MQILREVITESVAKSDIWSPYSPNIIQYDFFLWSLKDAAYWTNPHMEEVFRKNKQP
jgi:hypothetical protein